MNRISVIIEEVCRKNGINYKSKFKEKHYNNTLHKLADIYLQLKIIIGDLSEIEESSKGIKGVRKFFENTITILENVDHQIIQEAILISKEKK